MELASLLACEGLIEVIAVRPPDVSRSGMFISASRKFPDGAELNPKFRLSLTGAEIQTRCEVRYCFCHALAFTYKPPCSKLRHRVGE